MHLSIGTFAGCGFVRLNFLQCLQSITSATVFVDSLSLLLLAMLLFTLLLLPLPLLLNRSFRFDSLL
jgi:hypothetical protein